jgi:hypothetical protein
MHYVSKMLNFLMLEQLLLIVTLVPQKLNLINSEACKDIQLSILATCQSPVRKADNLTTILCHCHEIWEC